MTFDPLSYTLKLAQLQVYSALQQLDDCRDMPQANNLDETDAFLLQHTRNRLADCNRTLTILIPRTHQAQHSHPALPDSPVTQSQPQQMSQKSPSPHNGQPDRSKEAGL